MAWKRHANQVVPPLKFHYADFAASQLQWAESPQAKEQLDYWMQRLKLPLNVLDVPLDRAATVRSASKPALTSAALPAALVTELKALCRRESTTMFAVTAAAFAALLARYSRQSDIIFASPSANRSEDTADIIGPFAGLFAVRVDLSDDPALNTLVSRVGDTAMDALTHIDLPFEQIIERVDAPSQRGRNPLFQFFFLYQVAFLRATKVGTLAVEPLGSIGIGTPYELQLSMIERETGVTAQLEYNPAIYDASTVEKILADFLDVLERFHTSPQARVSQLPDLRQSTFPNAADGSQAPAADAATTAGMASTAPVTDLEISMAEAWGRVLFKTSVGLHDNFFDLGGNSLRVLRLVNEIRLTTGLDVGMGTIFRYPTIAELIANLETSQAASASMIVPLQAGGTQPPLYCLCGLELYSDLARSLGQDQPVFGIYVAYEQEVSSQIAQGISPVIDLDKLADAYLEAILRQKRGGPYRLAGLSAGGVIAMEVASRLRTHGKEVDAVFLLDTVLPGGKKKNWLRWMKKRAANIKLEDFEKLASRLQKTGNKPGPQSSHPHKTGTPAGEAGIEELKQRAFAAAIHAWQPQRLNSDFKVVLYRAIAEMKLLTHLDFEPDYGWSKFIAGHLTVEDMPGTHISMVRPPNAIDLANSILGHLKR